MKWEEEVSWGIFGSQGPGARLMIFKSRSHLSRNVLVPLTIINFPELELAEPPRPRRKESTMSFTTTSQMYTKCWMIQVWPWEMERVTGRGAPGEGGRNNPDDNKHFDDANRA